MSADTPADAAIRQALHELRGGDAGARDRLALLIYDDLRAIARALMRGERPSHTLEPAALVNEAWLRLSGDRPDRLEGRGSFLAAASVAMRRILVDHARRRASGKRGGGWERVTLGAAVATGAPVDVDVEVLSDALDALARVSERQASIVQLRWFGGMTNEEVADHLGLGLTTVKDEWTTARAWLRLKMRRP